MAENDTISTLLMRIVANAMEGAALSFNSEDGLSKPHADSLAESFQYINRDARRALILLEDTVNKLGDGLR